MSADRSGMNPTRAGYSGAAALRRRRGPRPRTTPTNPHVQLEQNAPAEMQEALFERARALPGVRTSRSGISLPDARAFVMGAASAGGPREAFMIGREFAHLHGPEDGSLHMTLPRKLAEEAIEKGWAERHQVAGQYGLPPDTVMVYGPRDEGELEVVLRLVEASHAFARGWPGLHPRASR